MDYFEDRNEAKRRHQTFFESFLQLSFELGFKID